MHTYTNPTTPRYQLPMDQLPRGFVPWPQRLLDALEREQQEKGFRFAEGYVLAQLQRETLRYFYEGIPVAFKLAEGGVEIVAVGWEETAPYKNLPGDEVRVVQP